MMRKNPIHIRTQLHLEYANGCYGIKGSNIFPAASNHSSVWSVTHFLSGCNLCFLYPPVFFAASTLYVWKSAMQLNNRMAGALRAFFLVSSGKTNKKCTNSSDLSSPSFASKQDGLKDVSLPHCKMFWPHISFQKSTRVPLSNFLGKLQFH